MARRRLALGMMGQSGTPLLALVVVLAASHLLWRGGGEGPVFLASGGRRQGKTQVSVGLWALGGVSWWWWWLGVGWGICMAGGGRGLFVEDGCGDASRTPLQFPAAYQLYAHDGSRLVAQPVADSLGCAASRQAQINAATAVGLGNEAGPCSEHSERGLFPLPLLISFWPREGGCCLWWVCPLARPRCAVWPDGGACSACTPTR